MDQRDDRTAARGGGERGDAATERVEDYLRLDEHIEQLRTDRRPRRPKRLPPDQARAYQMAALFRSAAPGAAEPDPQFAARLRGQLERELQRGTGRPRPRMPEVSRRGLLTGGLRVAAATAAGLAAGVAIDRAIESPVSPTYPPLVQNGTWLAVVAVDALPVGAVRRFATEQVVGFVRHTASGYDALSGACTHMGCLLAWNSAARTFDCPCHGGRFQEDGWAAPSSPVAYQPLPHMDTRVQDGQVWVYVPAPNPMADQPTATRGTGAAHDGFPYR
jgi:Rieske Fe-S protein